MNIKIPAWQKIMQLYYIHPELNANKIYHNYGITFSHVYNVLKSLQKIGWVDIEKIGRVNKITFTPEGEIIAEYLSGTNDTKGIVQYIEEANKK